MDNENVTDAPRRFLLGCGPGAPLKAKQTLKLHLPTRKLVDIGQDEVRPYEVHVTINSIDDPAPFSKLCDEFTDWAAANVDPKHGEVVSCKPIFIVLPEGVHKQQPMCSMFVHSNLD